MELVFTLFAAWFLPVAAFVLFPGLRDSVFTYLQERYIENHKHKLAREFFKFEHVHRRRFEVIEELHTKLLELEQRTKNIPLDIAVDSVLDALSEELRELDRYFETSSIFLSEETLQRAKDLQELLQDVLSNKEDAQLYRQGQMFQEFWSIKEKTIGKISSEIPKVRSALRAQLRKELGSDDVH